MEQNLAFRTAEETDAQELAAIYAPYVTDTAITFEYTVPAVEEFASRIRHTLQRYPYLVAIRDGQICGFAYASAFKGRAAYDWAVETTVYLRQSSRGGGVGKALYMELEGMLKRQNVLNLNACIAYLRGSDAHLDDASVHFHSRLGYSKVAHFTKCGYKFGTWYDMIWMEKIIGEHTAAPKPFIPFAEL